MTAVSSDLRALGVRDLYAYGSHARGDADAHSDRDVLAVVDRPPGSVEGLAATVRRLTGPSTDVAVYGADRLAALHADGDLFAWHLFFESECLVSAGPVPFLGSLGRPAPYSKASFDLASLRSLLEEVEPDSEATAVYDAGLLFVVVRNVAVIATAVGFGRPDFSHRAWMRVSSRFGLAPPLSAFEYGLFRLCRRASSGPPPPQQPGALPDATRRVGMWLDEVERRFLCPTIPYMR